MQNVLRVCAFGFAGLFLTTCGSSTQCGTITGTAWTPAVPAASASHHNSGITVTKTTQTGSGTVVGLGQAAPASVEISFPIDMTADLGALGSITLVASVTSFPSALQGGAYPMLVSLSDGTNEYINLARAGSGGDCAQSGYYTCASGYCSANSACTISQPSAYKNRTLWEQHQAPNTSGENSPSTNTFPTCNWSGGSAGSATDPRCEFNSTFFPGANNPPRLRYGVTYTAKYVLVADSYSSVSPRTGTMELAVYKKSTPATTGASAGAIDFNVILVGDTTVQASRTTKGQQNLNTLMESVAGYFSQTASNVTLGTVNAVEWACSAGGESYSTLNIDDLGTMLQDGSALADSSTQGKAMNLFLVSSITDDGTLGSSGFTILGFDGAIGGPPVHGTATSGLTVATFDQLDTFNADCSEAAATCPLSAQDADFEELGAVLAHEIGHYFGLNHLSESAGDEHDSIRDTPFCTSTITSGGQQYITLSACLNTDTSA